MNIRDLLMYLQGVVKASQAVVSYARKWATDIESEELAAIVVRHSITAAVSGMASGVLPGIAVLISSGIAIGAIWHMYYAVGKYLHMTFGKDMLKAAAAAILSNIVNQMWGVLAIELVAAFIPLISIPATGLIFFAITYFSGLSFLLMLVYIFKAGGDPTTMSAEEISKKAQEAAKDIDFDTEFKQAKEGFHKMRKEGNLENNARGVDIDSE